MRNLFKNTVLISILTLASRVLGMLRDVLIAMTLGVSGQSDAFFIAFRPFDLVRKLFSEGMLGISFVPVFTKIQHLEGAKRAAAMAWSFFFFFVGRRRAIDAHGAAGLSFPGGLGISGDRAGT